MAKKIDETLRNTIEGMLLAGKVTCEIACDTGVSAPTIGKIRKSLIKKGWGKLWHRTEGGYISQRIGV